MEERHEGFSLLPSQFACPPDGDLVQCARAWGKHAQVTLVHFSQPRYASDGSGYTYCICGAHDKCKARYKFCSTGKIWFKAHSSEAEHSSCPRIARASSQSPVPREALIKVKQLAMAPGERKRPLEINMQLEEPLPGAVVQRAVSKARKRPCSGRTLEIPLLVDFLEKHKLDLDRQQIPEEGVRCLWSDVREQYIGVVFCFANFLRRLGDLLLEQPEAAQEGLIAQTDYSGQVCWSGAKICVVGVQAYHRARSPDASVSARRWKKVLIPLVFALNPFEDSDHYSICFSWAKKLLMMLCFQRGVRAPQPLFHACHGDWTRSLQKNYKERLDARSSIFL